MPLFRSMPFAEFRAMPRRVALRQVAQVVHVAPLVLGRRIRGVTAPPLALVSIYRAGNAAHVERLRAALPAGAGAALWALDRPAPVLERWTVGSGPGARTALLNALHAAAVDHGFAGRALLVADDDVAITSRALGLFLRGAAAAELDIAQPGHLPRSHASWPFVRQQLLTVMRRTRFVEQGPLVLFSPRGVDACFPLPEALGMGWGLEALWAAQDGVHLGIVDAAGMRHLGPIAAAYGRDEQERQGRAVLAEHGFGSWAELQVDAERWSVGRRPPDWVRR